MIEYSLKSSFGVDMGKKISIKAYAKINLALDVLGKRQDGYHELETVLQGIDLHDVVEMERTPAGISVSCNWRELGSGPENLAYRAAQLVLDSFALDYGVKIHLQKKIPLAAGLAGGSTDAAAVLLGMNELFSMGLSRKELQEMAAVLGSDVPFCLFPLTAYARGRGEIITELPACPRLWLVVVKPPFGISTREVYAHLPNVAIRERPDIKGLVRALENGEKEQLFSGMHNVLEYAAFDLYPVLSEFLCVLREIGGHKVMMSGSGPTLLVFQEDEASARKTASLLENRDCSVYIARTIGPEDLRQR